MIQNMLTGVQVKVHKVYVPRVYEEFEDEGETTTYMPEGSTTDDDDDDISF
jgi:DNA-binding transcriptional regulator YhcF (GntR family)